MVSKNIANPLHSAQAPSHSPPLIGPLSPKSSPSMFSSALSFDHWSRDTLIALIAIFALLPASTAENQSPNYTLFVGVDLFLQHETEVVLIRKLERKKALLDTPNRDVVPLKDGVGFTWKMATKVSSVSATIDGLDSKRAFSPANDPKLQTMKMQSNVQGYLADRVTVAQAGIAQAASNASFADAAAANPYAPGPQSFDETGAGLMVNADAALDAASLSMDSLHTSGVYDEMTDGDGKPNQYDALEVRFDISSDSPIANAVVVVIADIKSGDTVASTSFHREVGKVTPKPRRVVITQLGMPAGYEWEATKIYLFNYGEEIPTNLSERSYKITNDQAGEFVQIAHLFEHKNQTLSARPVWSVAPLSLMGASDPRIYNLPVALDIDDQGNLVHMHETNQGIPSSVRTVLQQMTFLPALDSGKPVASTVTVNPADFFKD